MPTANIYLSEISNVKDALLTILPQLQEKLAHELTSGERKLQANEISIRVIKVNGAMIAPIEIEITAHAYRDRISQADEICLSIRNFVMTKIQTVSDVRVWLVLAELGHSWDA